MPTTKKTITPTSPVTKTELSTIPYKLVVDHFRFSLGCAGTGGRDMLADMLACLPLAVLVYTGLWVIPTPVLPFFAITLVWHFILEPVRTFL